MEYGKVNALNLQFKWADNYQTEDDIWTFYEDGDAAPYGRLNYVFSGADETSVNYELNGDGKLNSKDCLLYTSCPMFMNLFAGSRITTKSFYFLQTAVNVPLVNSRKSLNEWDFL